MAGESNAFLLSILAIIFPPAAVAFLSGCGGDCCLNCLLTLLGWLPGCIHAFWLIIRRVEADETYGYKNWTYTGMGVYFPGGQAPPGQTQPSTQGAPPPPPLAPPSQPEYTAPPSPPPAPAVHQAKDEKSAPGPADQSGNQGQPPPPSAPTEQTQGAQPTTPPSST